MAKKTKQEPGAELRMQLESITLFPVQSSNLESIGYVSVARMMIVRFKNGRTYLYPAVPEELFNNFLAAESKGTFFHQNIKGKYAGLAGEIVDKKGGNNGKEKKTS